MHLNGSVWVCMYTHTHTQTHTKYLSEGKKKSKGPHNLNTEGIIFLWSKCWKEKESTKKVLSLFLWMSTSAFIIAVSGCRGEASSCWELTPITPPPPHPTWVQPMRLQWLWPLFCTSVLIAAALLLWDLLTGSQTRPFYLERCPKASSGGHPNPTLSISSSLHPNDLQSQSLPPWRPLALSLLNFSPWHLLSLASNVLLSYFVYLICPPEM